MRTARLAIGVGVLVVATACGGGSGGAGRAVAAEPGADTAAPPSISAQAVGKATAPPDTITVGFNLHTEGASAQETLTENSLRTQQVLDTLKAQGVAADDVQTTNVSVGPRLDNRTPPRIIGYAADNGFTVKLRDLGKAGTQIDALVGVGGDFLQVQGISYSIGDPTAIAAQARADAVKRATDQAKQMAAAAGATLGALRTIVEVPQQPIFPYQYQYDSLATAGVGRGAASVAVPIAAGTQEVDVVVTVTFDLG